MSFFKELRRRKTGSRANKSLPNGLKSSSESSGTMPITKSSSTLDSVYGSSTPPSSIQPHQSTPNLVTSKSASTMTATPLPQRPMPLSSVSNRSSLMVGLSVRIVNGADDVPILSNADLSSAGIEYPIRQRDHNAQTANLSLCTKNHDHF